MLKRLIHIINPFKSRAGSEHDIAQTVTFESLERALCDASRAGIEVEVLCAVLSQDIDAVPSFGKATVIPRSIQDYRQLLPLRHFPLLSDILRVVNNRSSGEYVIYTNIDIAVQPHFYTWIANRIRQAGEELICFSINRRTLRTPYALGELAAMYNDFGEAHAGHDCFVFPSYWLDRLALGNTCIATRHFDALLIANLDSLSNGGFTVLRDEHLTFHLGDDQTWLGRPAYDEHNFVEAVAQIRLLAERHRITPGSHFEYLHKSFLAEAKLIRTLRRKVRNLLIEKGMHTPRRELRNILF